MSKLFLVQIKSKSILKEGKKAFLIPMSFENEEIKGVDKKVIHEALIRDAIKLYPQYTKIEDNPSFTISRISKQELNTFLKTGIYKQKSFMGA